jgi:hypothetical protein
MDWFERLTGFRETTYDETRRRLAIEDGMLVSTATSARHGIGELDLVSLDELRVRVGEPRASTSRLRVRLLSGDVRALHLAPEYAGALFQVASQFNLLEMASPRLTPEDGVTIYQSDPTQGPACAIAAGAATIFRNYFAPTSDGVGQTRSSQLDGLADLGQALSEALHQPIASLWTMRNGYAMCSRGGLEKLTKYLGSTIDDKALDALRGNLRIGVHSDVEVTDGPTAPRPRVSQAFCSALPVAYSEVPARHWAAFASLVLEAAYEATLWAAALNARRGASNIVLLTRLGGGAFGNEEQWIQDALRRALLKARDFDLDVRLVSYRAPSREMQQLAAEFN